jgi:hypothetical protein
MFESLYDAMLDTVHCMVYTQRFWESDPFLSSEVKGTGRILLSRVPLERPSIDHWTLIHDAVSYELFIPLLCLHFSENLQMNKKFLFRVAWV